MKKTILATLAIASMMSCSNEELLEAPAQQAITFGNTFVENAPRTRAAYDGSYTTNSLAQFQVYGIITNKDEESGRLFTGNDVIKNGSEWTYTCATQYWIPGNTYNFTAIVHGNEGDAISTDINALQQPTAIQLTDASVQKDILFAENGPITSTDPTWGEKVSFTFRHLLSKVKFTVKNGITTQNGYKYKVENIQITNAAMEGTYTIGTGWGDVQATETPFQPHFGHAVAALNEDASVAVEVGTPIEIGKSCESNFERLLIPATQQFNIQFDYYLYNGEQEIDVQLGKTLITKEMTLQAGHAYNFIINLANPGEPITFDVNAVEEWDTDHDDNGTKNDETPIN